jgi:hypothetical protein
MLSDERELTTTFVKGVFSRHSPTWNGADFDVWLRAVEAAVRAEQIEKDAALAVTWAPSDWDGWLASETPHWVANAIRAQLEGTTDE